MKEKKFFSYLLKQFPKEKDLIPEITRLMETSHQKYKSFKTPIKVDFGGGLNWGVAH